jgi:ankyrin repeat protein
MKAVLQNQAISLENVVANKKSHLDYLKKQNEKLGNQYNKLSAIYSLQSQISAKSKELLILQTKISPLSNSDNHQSTQLEHLNKSAQEADQKKAELTSKQNSYDEMFAVFDQGLSNYSKNEGIVVDTTTMVLKVLPKTEMGNPELMNKICSEQNVKLLSELIEKAENVNIADSYGMNLLMYSLKHGFFEGVEILLNKDIDLDHVDSNNCTALSYACTLPHLKYTNAIAEKTDLESVIQTANEGNSLGHLLFNNIAASKVYGDELSTIQQSAPINHQNTSTHITGSLILNTPNQYIGDITIGYSKDDGYTINQQKALLITKKLLELGANFNIPNHEGYLPFLYVCLTKQKYLARKLEKLLLLDIATIEPTGLQGALCAIALEDDVLLTKILQSKGGVTDLYDNIGNTLVHTAIIYNNNNALKILLEFGANVNTHNFTSAAPLAVAVSIDRPDAVKILANHPNTDLNILSLDQQVTALYLAAQDGKEAMVEEFIKQKAKLDIARADTGLTPLHVSMYQSHKNISVILIKAGADVHVKDLQGRNAILWSLNLKDTSIMQLLIDHGAKLDSTDNAGNPLLFAATKLNIPDIVSFLVKAGAHDVPNRQGIYAYDQAIGMGSVDLVYALRDKKDLPENAIKLMSAVYQNNLEQLSKLISPEYINDSVGVISGNSLLIQSLIFGYKAITHKLVEANASLTYFNKQGFTAWHIAAFKGYTDVLENMYAKNNTVLELKSQGASVCSSLWLASQEGQLDTVKWLLTKGTDSNTTRESDGRTALQANICCKKNIDVLEVLVLEKADVNQGTKDNFTPLYMAVEKQDLKIIKFLLEHGAKLDLAGNTGDQPIHMASALCNLFIMKILLDKGANIESQSNIGTTPLHEVVDKANLNLQPDLEKKLNAAKYLIARGAKIDAPNKEGKTALELVDSNSMELINVLEHPENIVLEDIESLLLGDFSYDAI